MYYLQVAPLKKEAKIIQPCPLSLMTHVGLTFTFPNVSPSPQKNDINTTRGNSNINLKNHRLINEIVKIISQAGFKSYFQLTWLTKKITYWICRLDEAISLQGCRSWDWLQLCK